MYTVEYLRSRRVWFEALLHSPASCSTKRAQSVHVPGHQVAKTVLVRVAERFVIVVLPSTSRIDLGRLAEVLRAPASELRLATTEELAGIFIDCEPGAVAPLGRLYGLDTVFDFSLTEVDELVIGGNTRHEGLRMRSCDYIALAQPLIGSFAVPIACGQAVASFSQSDCLTSRLSSAQILPRR
jgi:Ala-tRNA(Pro) deacylase